MNRCRVYRTLHGMHLSLRLAIIALLLVATPAPATAADLQPRTNMAFDRYVQAIEGRMPQPSGVPVG